MSFNSPIFLFLFLPVFLFIYFLIPKKSKKYWLLMGNLLFYLYSGVNGFLVLIVCSIINYLFGMVLQHDSRFKKIYLFISVLSNVLLLSFFKYFNVLVSSISLLYSDKALITDIIMPLGISFYTFQGISYLVDVYRKKIMPKKNIINFALYISFFPTILSGPLLRYNSFEDDLTNLDINFNKVVAGLKRFIIGLSKKALLADSLAIIVNNIWSLDVTDLTFSIALLGGISFALQIYFDFSGYSDMALGLGKMLGFNVTENFNYPYTTTSITNFWRSWNITLSNWFRDYIYIPLGGKKKNQLFNIFVVFLVTGLWHGLGFTYVVWAMINCTFNMLEKIFKRTLCNNNRCINFIKHIYVLLVVMISFIFFRSKSIDQAISFILAIMFNNQCSNPGLNITWFLTKYNLFLLFISIVSTTPFWKCLYQKVSKYLPDSMVLIFENLIFLMLLFLSIMAIVSSNYNSFIYFQF